MNSENKLNQIAIKRIYRATIQQVWGAWVDPAQCAEWWGPRGFTISTVRKDVAKAGDWLFTMHGPRGADYPNYIKFLQVKDHEFLEYDHDSALC